MARDPQGMAQTPEIMRRRLRVALREAREAAGLTQRDAAQALESSVSKIIRIEQGAVAITPIDLRALLASYGVTDEARVSELVDLARRSKNQSQSWALYKEVYSRASLALFESEAAAKTIYKFEPTFMPGLLQTEEYATELLRALGRSDRDVELMVSARLERQRLLAQEARPELRFVLGEAIVCRQVGGREVMLSQLARIKELGTRSGISIQILPFSAGAYPKMGAGFTILEFPDETLGDLLYLEHAGGERIVRDDPQVLADYHEAFATIEAMATRPDDLAPLLDGIEAQRFRDRPDV